MAQRRSNLAFFIGLVSCAATVTTVTWLTATMTGSGHSRHARSLIAQNSLEYTQSGLAAGREGDRSSTLMAGSKFREHSQQVANDATHQNVHVTMSKAQHGTNEGSVAASKATQIAAVSQTPKPKQSSCNPKPFTEYKLGDAIAWGPSNKQATAEACCASCRKVTADNPTAPCMYWVWCGDQAKCKEQYKDCWLKSAVHLGSIKPDRGPHVMWTSGILEQYDLDLIQDQDDPGGEDRTYHVVVTAQGPPTHWQARIAYYWYKKVQKQCQLHEKVCHMGGWTRLLHGGEPDDLMDEIPTVVVKPLEDKDNEGYVVLNRPWAFVQWLRDYPIKEKYVLMSEPDHLWIKPMPNLMRGEAPAAFPFFYITPTAPRDSIYVQRFTGPLDQKGLEQIPPIGNAPTLLLHSDLEKVAQTWMDTAHAIFDDREVHKAWAWVLEMWGFAISTFKAKFLPTALHWKMMCQIPYDEEPPEGPEHYILHYTYGLDYAFDGSPMFGKIGQWHFDKRTYAYDVLPHNVSYPPAGVRNKYIWRFIAMLHEATEMIPGWQDFEKTGVAKQFWDGKTFKAESSEHITYGLKPFA